MEEPRNAEGLTEAEFLDAYDVTKFERPSVTGRVDPRVQHGKA